MRTNAKICDKTNSTIPSSIPHCGRTDGNPNTIKEFNLKAEYGVGGQYTSGARPYCNNIITNPCRKDSKASKNSIPELDEVSNYGDSCSVKNPTTGKLPECWFRFFVIVTFLVVYMLIGAGVFCVLEREHEQHSMYEMKQFWNKFKKENGIADDAMKRFLKAHYKACEEGDSSSEEAVPVQWDFMSSFFFTGTILTTIGYGHSSPDTSSGRVFTIFYAIIGIPFMLGLLNVVAEILLSFLRICKSRWKRRNVPHVLQHEVFISAALWVILLLIIMTLIFKAQESGWNYEQSIYFSFITMTTIGFGDFVPGQNESESPTIIALEFANTVIVFISVLIWYFLSQVSAQVLKVKLKQFYFYFTDRKKSRIKNLDSGMIKSDTIVNNPPTPKLTMTSCVCPCTCGYFEQLADRDTREYYSESYPTHFSDSGGLYNGGNYDDQFIKDGTPSPVRGPTPCSRRVSEVYNNVEAYNGNGNVTMSVYDVDGTDVDSNIIYMAPPAIPSIVITSASLASITKSQSQNTIFQYDSGNGSSDVPSTSSPHPPNTDLYDMFDCNIPARPHSSMDRNQGQEFIRPDSLDLRVSRSMYDLSQTAVRTTKRTGSMSTALISSKPGKEFSGIHHDIFGGDSVML